MGMKEIRKYMSKIGKRGAAKGGKARAAKLTPEKRSEIARKAARARWDKNKPKASSSAGWVP
jgi:hypothetical protein